VTPAVPVRRIEALSRAVSCLLASFDLAGARALFDAALELAQQASVEPPELMLAMTKVYRAETRRTRAAEALDKAELIGGGTQLEALVWVERGEALEQDGDLDGAAKALQSALGAAAEAQAKEAARWHAEVDLVARLEGRLGGLFLQRKDVAHARHLFDSSAHHWRLAQVRAGEARALANLATACAVDRDLGAAARWFGTAGEAAMKAGDFLFAAKSYLQQARALKKIEPSSADARAAATEARKLAMAVGWEQGRLEAVQLLT
jgi:tetratricopeptide (TPR) repeat protein